MSDIKDAEEYSAEENGLPISTLAQDFMDNKSLANFVTCSSVKGFTRRFPIRSKYQETLEALGLLCNANTSLFIVNEHIYKFLLELVTGEEDE